MATPEEAAAAVAAGADGIGLLRTEFLFLGAAAMPDEDDQAAAYDAVAAALDGRPLTIRTLDAGADKPLPYLPLPPERNPFLGVHVTVTVDGLAKLGPTAIPAMWREDYGHITDIIPKESFEIAGLYPRFLTSKHHDVPALLKSEFPKYVRRYLVKQAQGLVPSVNAKEFKKRGKPGVRAQLLHLPTKKLEMDFVVEPGEKSTHMLNAVSPAWTSALAVGEYVVERIHAGGFTDPIKG